MTCDNGKIKNSDDRSLAHQEHRQISRLWRKAIEKQSSSGIDVEKEFEDDTVSISVKRRFDRNSSPFESKSTSDPKEEKKKFPSKLIQKKLAKGKSVPKIKSPLQKFDEIVTRELSTRRSLEGRGGMSLENSKQWSGLKFTGIPDFGCNKVTLENKISRGALHGMEKEVREFDPSNAENAALMDAIEKLAQAQAFCRFDAAVKAAEAATASVPPEMAEEVAVACAKDYQSDIIDVINEEISLSEERRPIEVVGYIGVTKLKENL